MKQNPSRQERFTSYNQKALFMLKAFSPSELQAYIKVDIPYKHGRKPSSPIDFQSLYLKSTGIPASTIHRFQTGEYIPRERSLLKLSKAYDKFRYAQLVSEGANRKDAKKLCKLIPEKIQPILNNYRLWAVRILTNYRRSGKKDIFLHYIQWGMAHPKWQEKLHREIGYNDWEMISKFSGLSRKKQRSKRHRKYQH